jgi:hypothetical protein
MIKETPLTELAAAMRPFGIYKSYWQLFSLASGGAFPVRRENRRVFAIGEPEHIAELIRADDARRRRKVASAAARKARKAA